MNPPLQTPFEAQRLASLATYRITDTPNEKEYDDIAALASYICRVPVSLITFIEEDRQWFKAAVGTDLTGNTRKDSFCTYALMKPGRLTMVPQATSDERFIENPVVTGGPKINFYAGVTLMSHDNQPIGTLCVLDVKPNILDEEQQKALQTLGDQVSKLLELRRKNFEIETIASENNRILQEKIDARTNELNEKNARLEQANREIERMMYVASHDLKEPVRKLKTYADLLVKNTLEPEKFAYFLGKVNTCSDHVYDLIKDIGELSEANSPGTVMEEVNLNNVLHSVIDTHDLIITDKKAQIQLEELPFVRGNYRQLEQLFANLLQNSLKYTIEKPVIKITVEVIRNANLPQSAHSEFYRINFIDNGIGFEQKYRKKIFEFFQRLHTRRVFEGNGIGLSIVKQVVRNHGGWVSAEGTPDQGAVFSIYLPKP